MTTPEPNRETARNVAFYVAAMAPAEQREVLGNLACEVVVDLIKRLRWGPEEAAAFTRAFVAAIVDQLPQMDAEQRKH